MSTKDEESKLGASQSIDDSVYRMPPRLERTTHLEARELSESITRFNRSQSNVDFLQEIRSYNHFIVGELNKIVRLQGMEVLDIGASPHSYAMEKCLELGVSRYVGIGLDIQCNEMMSFDEAEGLLYYMNAENLGFPDASFDVVVSMSTFEHIGDVSKALDEIGRVLRSGGTALISFEPLWTCAYGHHMHHLGRVSASIPPWSHLVWDANRMRIHLEAALEPEGRSRADEIVSMIFDDRFINRIGIEQMRLLFSRTTSMRIEWMLPMRHGDIDHPMLAEATAATGLSPDDLHTKGLSVLFRKVG